MDKKISTTRGPVDANGEVVSVGDVVVLMHVANQLLKGLPDEDQAAIKAQLGKHLTICAFDNYGNAELEFLDGHGVLHTIWIEPSCLLKQVT